MIAKTLTFFQTLSIRFIVGAVSLLHFFAMGLRIATGPLARAFSMFWVVTPGRHAACSTESVTVMGAIGTITGPTSVVVSGPLCQAMGLPMLDPSQNCQIFRGIVKPITVPMVDVFIPLKLPTQTLSHHDTMFGLPAILSFDEPIANFGSGRTGTNYAGTDRYGLHGSIV